jgi:DNA-binding NarL/FixJ family response regulator
VQVFPGSYFVPDLFTLGLSTVDQKGTGMHSPLRVFLVDDSELFLAALTDSLGALPYLSVIGCARSALQALTQVGQMQADVVVMDIAMPGLNGLEATRCLKALPDAPYVVILTMEDNVEYRAAAAAAGADGFVNKTNCDDELPTLLTTLLQASPMDESRVDAKSNIGRIV